MLMCARGRAGGDGPGASSHYVTAGSVRRERSTPGSRAALGLACAGGRSGVLVPLSPSVVPETPEVGELGGVSEALRSCIRGLETVVYTSGVGLETLTASDRIRRASRRIRMAVPTGLWA